MVTTILALTFFWSCDFGSDDDGGSDTATTTETESGDDSILDEAGTLANFPSDAEAIEVSSLTIGGQSVTGTGSVQLNDTTDETIEGTITLPSAPAKGYGEYSSVQIWANGTYYDITIDITTGTGTYSISLQTGSNYFCIVMSYNGAQYRTAVVKINRTEVSTTSAVSGFTSSMLSGKTFYGYSHFECDDGGIYVLSLTFAADGTYTKNNLQFSESSTGTWTLNSDGTVSLAWTYTEEDEGVTSKESATGTLVLQSQTTNGYVTSYTDTSINDSYTASATFYTSETAMQASMATLTAGTSITATDSTSDALDFGSTTTPDGFEICSMVTLLNSDGSLTVTLNMAGDVATALADSDCVYA